MTIVLHPPTGTKPEAIVKLHSGAVARSEHAAPYSVRITDEDDAVDLERRGWRRDLASQQEAKWRDAMLRKSLAAQDRYIGSRTRTEFGDVAVDGGGRVMVEHDQGADMVIIHGVSTALPEIDRDLRLSFVAAAAYFNAAQTQEEQTSAKALVGIVVNAVLRRHDFVGAKVRERIHNQRYE